VDVKEYIGDMDVMVLTSISEGQPFAVLEGMAAKKPFITTDVGGCRELLYGRNDNLGKAGTVVPVMDVEKISKEIIRLAEDPELRKKMGDTGYKRVENFYTSDKCVKSYRKIYRRFEGSFKQKG
jgi:glycosyltransferase involved in cell wall biosynthesis